MTQNVTQVLAPARWRHNLGNRSYVALFNLPAEIVTRCGISPNSKRSVRILTSRGIRLGGFATITSGTELRIPARYQAHFRGAAWFEAEIIGAEESTEVTLCQE